MKTLFSFCIVAFSLQLTSLANQYPLGLWAYENAKDGEPFIFVIGEQNSHLYIQMIPKNYEGEYETLPVSRLKSYKDGKTEYYAANIGKYFISVPKMNWYRENIDITIKNRRNIFSRAKEYPFGKPKVRFYNESITDGSIHFKNTAQSKAEVYYQTFNHKLLVKEIGAKQSHYQPTQEGMRWVVRVNDWEEPAIIGTSRAFQEKEIYDPYESDTPRIIGNNGSNPSNGDEELLNKTIWVNKKAGYNEVKTIIINGYGDYAFVAKNKSQYRDQYERSRIDWIYDNIYRMKVDGREYDVELTKSKGFLTDYDGILVAERDKKPVFFEKVDRQNAYGDLNFRNHLKTEVDIFAKVENQEIFFQRLEPGERVSIPSLRKMEWLITSFDGYNKEINVKGDYQIVDIRRESVVDNGPVFDNDPPINGGSGYRDDSPAPNPDRPATLIIGNPHEYVMRVYAENSNGRYVHIGDLEPGKMDIFKTFVGQSWIATKYNRTRIGQHVVEDDKDRTNFDD